jgi:hypothetical protein
VGGYAVKTLDDLRRERRADQRADRQREIDLEDERRHREADFQRETLLELQEALHAALKAAARDVMEQSSDAKNRGVPFPQGRARSETNEEEQQLLGRVLVIRARVKDDEVRDLTDAVTAAMVSPQALFSESAEAALKALQGSWQLFGVLNEHIGALLRERY